MRARNLKPSLFKNELLATSDPLYAWVFEGLWCLADREGRLQDRPRKIHLEINAGRAIEGTEKSLEWLTENDFIARYGHGQSRYIQIVNFKKHQNPHVREPASEIPAPDQHSASTVLPPDENRTGPALSSFPLPDSPSLIASPDGEAATDTKAGQPKTDGKGKPRGHLLPFPEDFTLTDAMREQALRRVPDCDVEAWFDLFRAHHTAHGKRMKSWSAAWITWIGNAEKFGYPRKHVNGTASESREMPDVSHSVWGH